MTRVSELILPCLDPFDFPMFSHLHGWLHPRTCPLLFWNLLMSCWFKSLHPLRLLQVDEISMFIHSISYLLSDLPIFFLMKFPYHPMFTYIVTCKKNIDVFSYASKLKTWGKDTDLYIYICVYVCILVFIKTLSNKWGTQFRALLIHLPCFT